MPPAPHPLTPILHPRTVAVLGASVNPGKYGGRVMNFLLRHGFQERVVPVNLGQTGVVLALVSLISNPQSTIPNF